MRSKKIKNMKHTLPIFALLLVGSAWAQVNTNQQQINQNPPPQVQQQYLNVQPNINPANNDWEVEENNQQNINKNDWDNENVQEQQNAPEQKEPCPDCDKIKKAKRENYGNNYAGNYSGGAQKFKRKKNWKRFCYNISHHSGHRKTKSNYSLCFNW